MLIGCKENENNFILEDAIDDSDKLNSLKSGLSELCQTTLKNMCTRDAVEKEGWQTLFYNLIESFRSTRFGEESFSIITKASKHVIDGFSTVITEGSEKIDFNVIPEKIDGELKLSSVFKPAALFLDQTSPFDIEHRIKYGDD
jgi:hypothetical protein